MLCHESIEVQASRFSLARDIKGDIVRFGKEVTDKRSLPCLARPRKHDNRELSGCFFQGL